MRLKLRFLAVVVAAACGCDDGAIGPATGTDGVAPLAEPAKIEIAELARVDAVLAEHRGKAVLLNFWAIWCQPCVAELPELAAVERRFRDQGGAVIGVSYDLMIPGVTADDVLPRMQKFVALKRLEYPILVFDGPDYDALNARFDLPGEIPVTLAFDRQGKLVDRVHGQASEARFEELMRKALGRE